MLDSLLKTIDRNVDKVCGRTPGTETLPRSKSSSLPRITLAAYVERVKPGVKLEVWQKDLCARHEKAFWLARYHLFKFEEVNVGAGLPYVVAPSGFKIDRAEFEEKKGKGTRAAEHAPPQHGKSIIVSHCLPAWILGYDPAHRFRLATMRIEHSRDFSEVVLSIMRSPEHTSIFTDPEGYPEERGRSVKWFTRARRRVKDAQASFIALGLLSGFVGTGADTLVMDDPYKSIEEALSEVIRAKTWRFYTDTARVRLDESSCAFVMFHRYHQDDIAGRAIASGEFTLWRYAAVADGVYVDENSGLSFPDPLGRPEGQILSPRKASTYPRMRDNEQVWNSQFQGRPTSKAGAMFNVERFRLIHKSEVPQMIATVRAWDNAATDEKEAGATAYTAGNKVGVDEAGSKYVFDVVRERVGTDEREALQKQTAERDGRLCAVRAPQDPGSAGKDIAFKFRQMLRDFQVETPRVTGSKTARAHNYSAEVNAGRYFIVCDELDANDEPVPPDWFKSFKEEHHFFPVGTTKDMVDAGSDADKYLTEIYHRGLVVKGRPTLLSWQRFRAKFGEKIPAEWEVAAAVRVSADASLPSAYCVTARASEWAALGERVLVVASARLYTNDPGEVISALKRAIERRCAAGRAQVVWMSTDGEDVRQLAFEKHALVLTEFFDGPNAGLPETNWYMGRAEGEDPFFPGREPSRCYLLVADDQLSEPATEEGLLSTRQELGSWSFNERGEPQPYGGVTLDCARMTLYNFALKAAKTTPEQRRIMQLPDHLKPEEGAKLIGTPAFVDFHYAREHALKQIKERERAQEKDAEKAWAGYGNRPAQHRRYRRSK